MFDWLPIDVRSVFDRCSIDVRIDRFSIDVRLIFNQKRNRPAAQPSGRGSGRVNLPLGLARWYPDLRTEGINGMFPCSGGTPSSDDRTSEKVPGRAAVPPLRRCYTGRNVFPPIWRFKVACMVVGNCIS